MVAQKELQIGKAPRNVIRGLNSQKGNEVGIHWLRISVLRRNLPELRAVVDGFFDKSTSDGYGLWSYDSRHIWRNGVSLNYDHEIDRSNLVHGGKVSLDIPGKALDEVGDLQFFLDQLNGFEPVCTRIDIFFDDYQRKITPNELYQITKKKDVSGFLQIHHKESRVGVAGKNETRVTHDELSFGRRGQNGCGKYLRVYDKNLESEGEKNCIRWEIEFTKDRANLVFKKLCETRSIDAFATLCGSLIGGSVSFIHRNNDKNILRLPVYDFWKEILDFLGSVVIRTVSEKPDIEGKYNFIYRQVSPTLALLREVFVDEADFFCWLNDVIDEGELRMSQAQVILAQSSKQKLRYANGPGIGHNRKIIEFFERL